ncbi:hypothetical protein KIN20_015633 [Parelaphostrongylus tenuis]|uniref:Uncharacterized protein n=1 Tax=Parelaphostrongylus tenuis TaxID=148309 RepID=A0AAD5MIT4_PARTN|nr:hypothetical protein KIN20_015633 [Parelaphostrongylus tenuis]
MSKAVDLDEVFSVFLNGNGFEEPISSSDDEDSTGAEAPTTTPVTTRDTDLPHVETQLRDDVDVELSPTEDSKMSRILLQVVRLHLNEHCISPGCSAKHEAAENLKEKVDSMEETRSKLQEQFTVHQLENERLVEEITDLKRRITRMENLIKHQSIIIRDIGNQLRVSQKSARKTKARKSSTKSKKRK